MIIVKMSCTLAAILCICVLIVVFLEATIDKERRSQDLSLLVEFIINTRVIDLKADSLKECPNNTCVSENITWRMSDNEPFPREADVPVKSRTSSIS